MPPSPRRRASAEVAVQPTIAVCEIQGDAGRYRLGGVAAFGNARRLLEDGRRRFGAEPVVAIDLEGLTGLDSAGLAVLLAWLAEARVAGRKLVYRGLPPALVATARVAGVEALVGVPTP